MPVFPASPTASRPISWPIPASVSLRVETYVRADPRHPGQPACAAASGASCSSTAMAATSRRARWRSSGWPTIRRCSQVPQLVERAEDLRQGAGDRPGRLARLLDGELSLDAARGRRPAQPAQADDRPRPHAADESGEGARLSRRRQFRRLLPAARRGHAGDLGRSRSPRRGRCSKAPGHERTADPDLGRRRHRRHARAPPSSAPARTCCSSTAPPTMSRRSTSAACEITGPIARPRCRRPAVTAGRASQAPSRPHLALRQGAGHGRRRGSAAAASGRRRLRRLRPERAQRAGHRRGRRRRAHDRLLRQFRRRLPGARAWSCTAGAARSWSASSTARTTPRVEQLHALLRDFEPDAV